MRAEMASAQVQGVADIQPPLFTKFNSPVYSLATEGVGPSGRGSMNLVTYCAPVAIKPERMFAVGLYLGTQSHEHMRVHRRGVLQVLQKQHASLFQLLGKTSSRDVDKLAAIRDKGFALEERFGIPTLEDAACVMELQVTSDFMPCGDHDVVLCKVVAYENLADDPSAVLYTDTLRKAGLM
ncbi:hypothetical protein HYH02_000078 [Chlamydomonas schloesseri]|uniref:Flavin reductase like domain-containing protein n=1 Tax=Chlamydomonas schloesseri TaxID=2026947 RepID=A0A835WMJ6_9CHLO|nr:hypothetical protein HYH02_000078 [Chlamydomonas schloesseri]|eukprot:KAG2449974.1 hypothetical protein HYH02_000078 [Chlamydomonas schloesseri]